ncbi:MAG: hypothetical protein ABIF82_14325 [Planctomycetota bacterium]
MQPSPAPAEGRGGAPQPQPPEAQRPPPAAAASPETPPAAARRSFPMSVFAEDEPAITVRRSTLIFAAVVVVILFFIAFALGRRTAPRPKTSGRATVERNSREETRRPAVPDELRNKSVICLRVFSHTQEAGPANARAYREFLNESPDAAFIRSSGKKAFILAHRRELEVCVGPFDGLATPLVNELLPRLRELRHNGVCQFRGAEVQPVPVYAKVFN